MGKSKNRKDHKKKSAARTERLKVEKRRQEKLQREFIMNLIEQEKNKGMFDNLPQMSPANPSSDVPSIDLTQGPII
jgi:hypothetical protein